MGGIGKRIAEVFARNGAAVAMFVAGVADPEWGEVVTAWVVPAPAAARPAAAC